MVATFTLFIVTMFCAPNEEASVSPMWDGLSVCPIDADTMLSQSNANLAKGDDIGRWLICRSDCHYALGNLAQAEIDLRNAIKLGEELRSEWRQVRIALEHKKKTHLIPADEGALSDGQRIVRCWQLSDISPRIALKELSDLPPTIQRLETVHFIRSIAYAKLRDWNSCIESCDKGLQAKPSIRSHKSELFALKGKCWFKLGEFLRSANCRREVLVDWPENTAVQYSLLESLTAAVSLADAYLEAMVGKEKTSRHYYIATVCAIELVGVSDGKPGAFVDMARKYSGDRWTELATGQIHCALGDLEAAKSSFAKAESLGGAEAPYWLILLESTSPESAIRNGQSAVLRVTNLKKLGDSNVLRPDLMHLVFSTAYAESGEWNLALEEVENAKRLCGGRQGTGVCEYLSNLYRAKKPYRHSFSQAEENQLPVSAASIIVGLGSP